MGRPRADEVEKWGWLRQKARTIRQGVGMMTQHAELLARYQHLRQVGLQLNNRLVQTLSRNVLDEGGQRLGILQKNVLTLDSEDEVAVLMDYCIHDVRPQGANAIERYLAESPPPPDSDEMLLLQALQGDSRRRGGCSLAPSGPPKGK